MLDFANDVREMLAEGAAMARDVREKLAAERTVKLPRHVRFFTRQSRKGLPAPACAVALERGTPWRPR